jgi:hypothetical protein
MARIIRKGSLPESRKMELTCSNCKTVAEFTYSEGRPSSDQRDGNAICFECPLCHKDIWRNDGPTQQWDR